MSDTKYSYIDTQRLARDFKVGDTVLLPIYTRGNRYAPSIGRVTCVLPKIGYVDVETPFGNIRFSPEELVKDTSQNASYLEDTSMDTWERRRCKKVASAYGEQRASVLWTKAASLRRHKFSLLQAYHVLSEDLTWSDHELRQALYVAYAHEPMTKTAIYWKAKGRRYMPSRREIECGVFDCPCCRHPLSQTHYKKHTKLYVCKECLFTIRPADMLEPGQELEVEDDFEKSPVDFFSANDPLLRSLFGDRQNS